MSIAEEERGKKPVPPLLGFGEAWDERKKKCSAHKNPDMGRAESLYYLSEVALILWFYINVTQYYVEMGFCKVQPSLLCGLRPKRWRNSQTKTQNHDLLGSRAPSKVVLYFVQHFGPHNFPSLPLFTPDL